MDIVQKGIGMIIMVVLCSLVPTVGYILLEKRDGIIKEAIKKHIFYAYSAFIAGFWFILSFLKYSLGYHKENLLESFWNAQFVTYLHYGIPLIIIGVVMPFMIHHFREYIGWKFIRLFDSVFFFVFSYTFLLNRKINNTIYCATFLLAFIVTVIYNIFADFQKATYISKANVKQLFMKVIPFILYWFVTIALYTPNELYLNNASDFPMPYWYFFGKLFLGSGFIFVLLLCGVIGFLSEKQQNIYCILLFTLITIGYIQGMFFNGSMKILDGEQQAWNQAKMWMNLAIWCFFAVVFFAIALWKKNSAIKLMQIVCIWLSLTQAVSLVVLIITSDETGNKSQLLLTTDGMLEVAEENNIIVFVLDKFDGRRMDEILEEDKDFLEPLKDFTYYLNTTSEFSPTQNSIPYLLTGAEYQCEGKGNYLDYAYDGEVLLKDIYQMGYQVGVYTDSYFVPTQMKGIVDNYKDGIKRECGTWELAALMTQCSYYKLAPFIIKEYYQYDTSDIATLVVDERITNINNDLPFYQKLISDGLQVSSDKEKKGNFRFIHMHGAHPPYIMTENFRYLEYDASRDEHWGSGVSQAKGALNIVFEYIRQLKELGKYEDAMIVITADHGYTEELSDENGNMQDISFPILFVKSPYDKNDIIQISNAPVCHADIIATIRQEIGIDIEEKTLDEYEEDEERVRFLKVSFENNPTKEYEIDGNVREIGNWTFLKEY